MPRLSIRAVHLVEFFTRELEGFTFCFVVVLVLVQKAIYALVKVWLF
jgi:hypothetical protein